LFCESFCRVAVKFCVPPPARTLAVAGDTVTTMAGAAATVIMAAADFVPSATEVAVRVTVAGLGTLDGAVYVMAPPEVGESVPHALPLQLVPDKLHVTPLL
jgi:hypothetical protein